MNSHPGLSALIHWSQTVKRQMNFSVTLMLLTYCKFHVFCQLWCIYWMGSKLSLSHTRKHRRHLLTKPGTTSKLWWDWGQPLQGPLSHQSEHLSLPKVLTALLRDYTGIRGIFRHQSYWNEDNLRKNLYIKQKTNRMKNLTFQYKKSWHLEVNIWLLIQHTAIREREHLKHGFSFILSSRNHWFLCQLLK